MSSSLGSDDIDTVAVAPFEAGGSIKGGGAGDPSKADTSVANTAGTSAAESGADVTPAGAFARARDGRFGFAAAPSPLDFVGDIRLAITYLKEASDARGTERLETKMDDTRRIEGRSIARANTTPAEPYALSVG